MFFKQWQTIKGEMNLHDFFLILTALSIYQYDAKFGSQSKSHFCFLEDCFQGWNFYVSNVL